MYNCLTRGWYATRQGCHKDALQDETVSQDETALQDKAAWAWHISGWMYHSFAFAWHSWEQIWYSEILSDLQILYSYNFTDFK